MTTKCLYCNKDLSKKQISRKNKTCSYSCCNKFRYRNVKRVYICNYCKKEYVKKNTGTNSGTKYCSKKCAALSRRIFSEEHKKRISESSKREKIRKEGDYRCDRCGREFTSNTSVRAHKAHCGHLKEVIACDMCGKEYKGASAFKMHLLHKHNEEWKKQWYKVTSEASRKSFRERIERGISHSCNTDIEILLKKELEKRGISFKSQYFLNKHPYDFYLPDYNLLVEADGDYWHGRNGTERSWQEKTVINDVQRTKFAIDNGYKIIRFWGSDIINSVEDCVEELENYGKTGKGGVKRIARCL